MRLDDDAGLGGCLPSASPVTLRIGELTVTLSPPHHDDAMWTSLEPSPSSGASPDLAPFIRLDLRPGGVSPAGPGQAGEDGTPLGPQAGGPTPPPRDTPS